MPDFNSLDASLALLYDYAYHFRVSIDLVQKLAQFLKLDTFIDTEVPSATNIKRLSIAGSLLLVDVDFADNLPSKVSLSSGNHHVDATSTQIPPNASEYIILEDGGDDTVVKVNFKHPDHMSFLQVRQEGCSVAEHILFSNLSNSKLGMFPANLKYLANLDSMSPPDGDLVVYMDNVAVYLGAIHATEAKLNPDWQVLDGYASRLGKVGLNDVEKGYLGVVLLFWEENRYIEHTKDRSNHPTIQKAILSIEESLEPSRDYISDAMEHAWKLKQTDGTFRDYTFIFDAELHLHNGQSVTSNTSRNWVLVLNLQNAVYLPESLIDYLGLDYKVAKEPKLREEFERLSTGKIEYEWLDMIVSVVTDEVNKYYAVESVRLESLNQLSKIFPILRNYLAFTALIRNIADLPGAALVKDDPNEASKRLKDSLKLSGEVADEELVGLGTVDADYMAVPLIGSDTDLLDFVNDESNETPEASNKNLLIVLSDVVYDSLDTELMLSVSSSVNGGFSTDFVIRNGQIEASGDVDMDNSYPRDYCRALSLSEDPLLALQAAEK